MIFLVRWNRVLEFERRDHGGCFEELGCRDGIFFTFPFFRPERFSIGKLIHLMKPDEKAPSGATYSAGNCLAELFSKKKARGHLPSSSPTLLFHVCTCKLRPARQNFEADDGGNNRRNVTLARSTERRQKIEFLTQCNTATHSVFLGPASTRGLALASEHGTERNPLSSTSSRRCGPRKQWKSQASFQPRRAARSPQTLGRSEPPRCPLQRLSKAFVQSAFADSSTVGQTDEHPGYKALGFTYTSTC
jgi:hypothetical protein